MEAEDKVEKLIYQHNHLIRTNLNLGELEARILTMALENIHQSDTGPLPPIKLRIEDVVPGMSGRAYKLVHEACLALYDHDLRLIPLGSDVSTSDYRTRIVSDISIDAGTGYITGNFAPKIRPYLMELTGIGENGKKKGHYTSVPFAKVLSIRNPNTQRLYWLLRSYQSLVVTQISLDELQAKLFEDKSPYPKWGDFKRFVLDIAKEQLADSSVDFPFTFEPQKTGKKVTGVKFTLPKENPRQPKPAKQLAAASKSATKLTAEQPASATPLDVLLTKLKEQYGQEQWQLDVMRQYLTVAKNAAQLPGRFENVNAVLRGLDKTKVKTTLGGYTWTSLVEKCGYLDTIRKEMKAAKS